MKMYQCNSKLTKHSIDVVKKDLFYYMQHIQHG